MSHACPKCGGPVRVVPDAYTFYPRGFCYVCDACRIKIHPNAVE